MLPFSSERYKTLRDYSLLIRFVSLRDLGPYTCQAYNGLGKAASWTVTLQSVGPVVTTHPDDQPYLKYLIAQPLPPVQPARPRPPPRIPPPVPSTTERFTFPTTTTTARPYAPSAVDENEIVVPSYLGWFTYDKSCVIYLGLVVFVRNELSSSINLTPIAKSFAFRG